MAKFEVHIPAIEQGGFNITLKVGADNWTAALKAGMQKLGEQGAVGQNVMVDIQEDNSIHVTEPVSGRVFRIRELTEEEAARATVKRPSGIMRNPLANVKPEVKGTSDVGAKTVTDIPAVKTEPITPAVEAKTQPAPKAEAKAEAKSEAKTEPPAKAAEPPAGAYTGSRSSIIRASSKSSPRIELRDVEELERPLQPITAPIGRPRGNTEQSRLATEEMLSDVFMRITELEAKTEVEAAMQFILNLAMEKVPCESGSMLRADAGTGDLSFVVANGPRAKELLKAKIVVPAGTGFAGFCSAEGVTVAVSDVQKDQRFYAAVSKQVDYETKSLLCCPVMTHGRSFGCVQLINRKGGPQFLEQEVGVLSYLSHQAALYLNTRL